METAGKLVEDDEAAEAMKDSGLGTPATRAATIERLIDAEYVEREGKQLRATAKGDRPDHDARRPRPDQAPTLTGDWEQRLFASRRGEEPRRRSCATSAKLHEETVAWFADKDRSAMRVERRVVGPCPRCDGEIVERPKSYSLHRPGSRRPSRAAATTLWKEVGGRTITFEEAQEYVSKGISADDLKPERVVIGPCPTPGCGGEIIERAKSYGCTSWKSRSETGCGFVIWTSRRAARTRSRAKRRSRWCARAARTRPRGPPPSRSAPCPTEGCDGEIVEKARQLRLHLVEEQEEARLRLRDLEDPARTRS